MQYQLIEIDENYMSPDEHLPLEVHIGLFNTVDEIIQHIVHTRYFAPNVFDTDYFKGKIQPKDCWKKLPRVKRKVAKKLIKTMEDFKHLAYYELVLWETVYEWYKVPEQESYYETRNDS